ncbi:RNA-directed DNA polymerase from transposon X-element [Paramuricea clavata]|uniref:RNA-directed DNA polymerase from transposon X-element n=1 Tax=Paramuricea clavata TaxID=317549 RepID=A0A6S7GTX0_PARCT|nr:RNA-directed DNA polymerase from transposon X-element [Paramuricea clavata]
MVYQTPSAHCIMTKRTMHIGSEITTLVDDDSHFVVVRPKAFVDSSGTTWASEIVRLRTMHPAVFEIPLASDDTSFSAEQRGSLCKIEYAVFQYLDMTEEEDVKKVSAHDDCPHRKYERNRVQHLLSKINNAGHIEHDADRLPVAIGILHDQVNHLKQCAQDLEVFLATASNPVATSDFIKIKDSCRSILATVKEIDLPRVI